MPVFKVWTADRAVKKSIVAENCQDLIEKGKLKLGLNCDLQSLSLVLEEDGTEIDDDEVLSEFRGAVLILLEPDQSWLPKCGMGDHINDAPAAAEPPASGLVPAPALIPAPALALTPADDPVPAAGCRTPSHSYSRITASTPLPEFTTTIKEHLKQKTEYTVWNKIVCAAADHYRGINPAIDSPAEYKAIGRALVTEYPSLARDGEQPWSFLIKGISQRVRHVRWSEKKKTNPIATGQGKGLKRKDGDNDHNENGILAKTARGAALPSLTAGVEPFQTLSENDYTTHLDELNKEWCKGPGARNLQHIKLLLRETFKHNQEWIRQLPDSKTAPILKKIACYENGDMVCHDFKLLITEEKYKAISTNLDTFTRAVEDLMGTKQEGPERMLNVLQYVEKATAFEKGRGKKTQSVLVIKDDIPDAEIVDNLRTAEKSPPHLVTFRRDGKVNANFVVADGVSIMTEKKSVAAATLVLIATYYLFDLDYPKIYSQVLGTLQTHVVKAVPYEGKKSSKYTAFNNLLKRKMAALEGQRKDD